MTQIFDENGIVHAVTVVEAGPVTVTQVKTATKEGYDAVQVAYGAKKRSNKPMRGHFKKLGDFRMLKEFRLLGDGQPGAHDEESKRAKKFSAHGVLPGRAGFATLGK